MSEYVNLNSADGHTCPAYVAYPGGPARGAVVLLQEIFGVNAHIRAVADDYAAAGYLVVAPSTFSRVQNGVELGYTDADMQAGFALKLKVDALPPPGVMADIQAAIDWAGPASGGAKVAVIGFCWGGLLAWRSACLLEGLAGAVTYYGGGMTEGADAAMQTTCAVMAHFARNDPWIPFESVQHFAQHHHGVLIHSYDATHGFNCDQRGAYHQASAQLARQRTLDFLALTLG